MKIKKRVYAFAKVAMSFGFFKACDIFFRQMMASDTYTFKINNRDITLRKNSSDFEVFFGVFAKSNYKIKSLLNLNPKVIVDLGVNIGLSVSYFKMDFPDALVIGLEPDPENFKLAVENTKQYSNVALSEKAIWFENTAIELKDSGEGEYALSMVSEGKVKVTIDAITMEELIKKYDLKRINFLKVDIEGAELELFSKGSVDWLKLVDCIMIELHDWNRPGCSETFFRALYPYSYSLERHGESVAIFFNHK